MAQRYLAPQVVSDLAEKMVFLAGPRQVGKTTLAKALPGGKRAYLNWDVDADRQKILKKILSPGDLWIFDELHKFRGWRNYLKGLYDGRPEGQRILVTGSARLDWYRFGGDSLQGRYHFLRLHPLSLAELDKSAKQSTLEGLFELGGFPEPFFRGSKVAARRWSLGYRARLTRDELPSVEQLFDYGRLELLMSVLPERVGSPLSLNNLAEDLHTSQPTVQRWVQAFERLYAIYRLPPFGAPRLRAVKKEQKHYHFDWTTVVEPGPRFENLIAGHLLKWVDHERDTQGRELELRYFRDVDGREVDFIVVERRKPILAVECKLSQGPVDRGLLYFKARFPDVEAWQVSYKMTDSAKTADGIRLASATELLRGLI